jgi:HK97 family phage prohead protease
MKNLLKADVDYEVRDLEVEEIRVDEEGDSGPVIRVSIKFNSLSVPLGMFARFREKISPTAFDGALDNENHEVLAFWNHNTDMPIGRRSAGTVAISKTSTLFKAEIRPGDTSWAVDAVKAIKRKDVKGTSFGFRIFPQGELWEEDADKNLIRTLTNVDLIEVSPTPMPAYPTSSATLRSYEAALDQFKASDEERSALAAAQIAARQWRDRLHCSSLRRR